IRIDPTGTRLWVTVAGGANAGAVAEFDMDGNYLGNFIEPGTITSPWAVVLRESDVLVPDSGDDSIKRFDYDGNFLGVFHQSDGVNGIDFPQQAILSASDDVLAAGFSSPSGAYEFDGATGDQIGYYDVVSGLRGIYELPSGNLLVTNSTGLHEITRS